MASRLLPALAVLSMAVLQPSVAAPPSSITEINTAPEKTQAQEQELAGLVHENKKLEANHNNQTSWRNNISRRQWHGAAAPRSCEVRHVRQGGAVAACARHGLGWVGGVCAKGRGALFARTFVESAANAITEQHSLSDSMLSSNSRALRPRCCCCP